MSTSKDDKVRSTATVWCSQPTSLSIPQRLQEIADQLYFYRNPPKPESPEFPKWQAFVDSMPPGSTDEDAEVMAAVEHYFYARSNVATGEYSADNMKAMILGYQLLKKLGFDLRHNNDNPTTPPSRLQEQWALLGVAQGVGDLNLDNARRKQNKQHTVVPPKFRLPPNFVGAYGGKRLDKFKY